MSTMTTEAIRKTVLVDFAPAEAFELFTTRVSSWWPTETHSYAHDKVTDVIFEPRVGGLLYEVTDEGTAEWARITAWEPPHRLALEWLIGKVSGTEVEVRFSPGRAGIARGARTSRLGTRPGRDRGVPGLQPGLGRRACDLRREREALDADVDRLPGRAVAQERGDELGEPAPARTAPRRRRAPPASTSGWRSRTRMRAAPRVNTGAGSKAGVRSR